MAKLIRVLHVFGVLGLGGAESRTVDLYRAMDRGSVQFDFLVHTDARGRDKNDLSSDTLMKARAGEYYDETVRALGARIFAVPRFHGTNIRAYRQALQAFFAAHKGEWEAVQGHITSTAAIYLPIARAYGATCTIAHARSAGTEPGLKGFMTGLLQRPLQKDNCPHIRFAVSRAAGEAVFGKKALAEGKVHIIPNAIDLKRYAYNAAERKRIRDEYGLGGACVIGHVGRFHYAKNHAFLVKIFAALKPLLSETAKNSDAAGAPHVSGVKLLLAGEGELMEETRALVREEGLSEDVIFAGNRKDIAALDAAMDLFLFPSRYEGMPGALIEAEAAGLPCLISNGITQEAAVADKVERMSILEQPSAWAKSALALCVPSVMRTDEERSRDSAAAAAALESAGFDVHVQAKKMEQFYRGQTGADLFS